MVSICRSSILRTDRDHPGRRFKVFAAEEIKEKIYDDRSDQNQVSIFFSEANVASLSIGVLGYICCSNSIYSSLGAADLLIYMQ